VKDGCPFCDYAGPSEILLDRDGVFFITPINPVVDGHVLAVSRAHADDALADPDLTGVVFEAAAWFASAGDCNLITSVGEAATQTIRHLHVHIVPRTAGDRLALPWADGRERYAHDDVPHYQGEPAPAMLDPETRGMLEGLGMYAWWKEGTQWVGTCGTTLRDARVTVLRERGYEVSSS
jgi:histidine triad (HIT) family protein